MLLLTGRSPSKVLVSRAMGTITHADLISTYDSRFQLERGHETVPFRLTRNMQSFIGPQGMEGMVVCAITAAAQALQAEPATTSSVVSLFFRCARRQDAMRQGLVHSRTSSGCMLATLLCAASVRPTRTPAPGLPQG